MARRTKPAIRKATAYIVLIAIGALMVYPILFLISASFKTNQELFGSASLLPKSLSLSAYAEAWSGVGRNSFARFLGNTFILVIPTVAFTIVSSTIVAYGFARFNFPFKRVLTLLMISTLMLPNAVLVIPRYIMFTRFGWANTYLPFIVPALFACYPFFIFLLMQFMRGIPRELDEAAFIDGCGSFRILVDVIAPLCAPALFSAGILQFIWTWNDFFNSLIYINSVSKFPIALGLRLGMDTAGDISWNKIMAMSFMSIVPCVVLFFSAQKSFIEGIATTGMKG